MAGAAPLVVPAGFLMDRQADWSDGYSLLGPDALAAGLDPDTAASVRVVVTGGSTLPRALTDQLPALEYVACFSTGFEAIDVGHLKERGIAFTTAAGVNAHDVADHAWALFLARWHDLLPSDRIVKQGRWGGFRQGLSARRSLRGKTAGVLGLGRIGKEIATRAEASGMTVIWWGPNPRPDARWPRAASLHAMAEAADVLFVAARASPGNVGLVDAAALAALGPEGMLVNISRGSLVDEVALLDALADGSLGGAGLDVFVQEPTPSAPWAKLGDRVVLAPHTAGYTREAGRDMFGQLRENLRRFHAGEPLLTPYY